MAALSHLEALEPARTHGSASGLRVCLSILTAGLSIAAAAYLAVGVKLGSAIVVPSGSIWDTRVPARASWQIPAAIAVASVGIALAALIGAHRRRA